MGSAFNERVNAIAWGEFTTAYGPAVKVPDQLRRLAGADRKVALAASHDLWCGLCHQHAQLGSAALPAMPFLLEVLDSADRSMTVELLDILLGFAIGTNRRRAGEYQQAIGGSEAGAEPGWVVDLRVALERKLPRFQRFASSQDEEIAAFAQSIVAELGGDAGPNHLPPPPVRD